MDNKQWQKILYNNKLMEALPPKANRDDVKDQAEDAVAEIEDTIKVIQKNLVDAKKALKKGVMPGIGTIKRIKDLANRIIDNTEWM